MIAHVALESDGHREELASLSTGNGYSAPEIIDLGEVRELTKGSSGSGSADANSQYYWA